jgi:hypothetical protein
MIWQFSKSKISSGRFILTVTAGVCFVMITWTLCDILRGMLDQLKASDILPYLATMSVILSNIFTFYFTKKAANGHSIDDE